MKILIENIEQLLQVREANIRFVSGNSMQSLPLINKAFLLIDNEQIADFGEMQSEQYATLRNTHTIDQTVDASGRVVMPAFCDSHTHIVYAGSREAEFVDKIKGLSYEEIARRGGGILNSAQRLQAISEEELYNQSVVRLNEVIRLGTGALEIKSGYGLSTEAELKMLRVIKKIKQNFPVLVKSTFLGAHSIPAEYRQNQTQYVDIVVNEMIPQVAEEQLAEFIDVFCDKGFFTETETERILQAGAKYGLRPKIHANELDFSGGVQVGVKLNALSVDHLECVGDAEIEALIGTATMPTVLPSTAFFLGMKYPPARRMIDAGLPVALASDYNPGSSPSGNMQFVLSLASIKLKMLPEEALNAATLNSAYAMGVETEVGSITKGKLANLLITKPIPSFQFLSYSFGSQLIDSVYIAGKPIGNQS